LDTTYLPVVGANVDDFIKDVYLHVTCFMEVVCVCQYLAYKKEEVNKEKI